jgi:hypothetical protein
VSVNERLEHATAEDLERFTDRILEAQKLEDVFG